MLFRSRSAFVERLRWLDEAAYADIVALCQFLPGPASSQVGISLGLMRAGLPGAFFAWLGFTVPSAIAMIVFAYEVEQLRDVAGSGWLHGLKIVAVAVVAQAVWSMARSLCPDWPRKGFALAVAAFMLVAPTTLGQIAAIAAGAAVGSLLLKRTFREASAIHVNIGKIGRAHV